MKAPAHDPAHNTYRCAAKAAIEGAGASLLLHGATPVNPSIGAALLAALALLAAHGNVRFHSNN